MTSENVELRIPSIMGYEKVAMDFAASTAKKMGFSPDRIEDLKTSVAEACINAIEHGNQMDISTKVDITLTVQESALEVTVQDRGKGPGEIKIPNIDEKIEGLEPTRGWGMFLIKSLMNEVSVQALPEGGNVLKMVIHLENSPAG
jgi:serine/threonine-protein kinase RsbW